MVSKRNDYSFLLDKLRYMANNYLINSDGSITESGEIVNDEDIILNVKFAYLYDFAYRNLNHSNNALLDYGVFNSFMNTCVKEYEIYEDINTGQIVYMPFREIFEFFFSNYARKNILMKYIKENSLNLNNHILTNKR